MSCPPPLVYSHCEHGCPRHCEGNMSSCGDHPLEGCFCPPHQVLLGGSCVPEETCTQCVSEDGVRRQVGALACHLPWGCFSPGVCWVECSLVTGPFHLWQQGTSEDREAGWRNGFGVGHILVQIPGLSCISCVIQHPSVNHRLLLLLLFLSLYA